MTKIIALANQKGGVGKTTTCINLAASLAASQQRVLMADMDPQGNATVAANLDKNKLDWTINEALLGTAEASNVVYDSGIGFDVIPANGNLTMAEVRLLNFEAKDQRLSRLLGHLKQYDFILIDCPPALNILTVNALVAADKLLIPMQCEYYALEGLTGLMNTYDQLRRSVNPQLELEGVLRTMYDGRNRLSWEVSQQLKSYFGDKLLNTVIPRNVRLAEAPSYGKPVLHYDKRSQGAAAYLALAGELLRRNQTRQDSQERATHEQ